MISKMAVKRPVTTTMIICIIIAFGILSITKLKLDLLPNMNIPVAVVNTTYNGAGPSEIENLITVPIEGAISKVPGVKEVNSTSSNGSSMVIAIFEDNVDVDMAAIDMREKIDLIKRTLPTDATDPMIIKIDPTALSSLKIGVTSSDGNMLALKNIIEDKIVNRFERQDGVASVSIAGGEEKEIQIKLIEDKLRGYGLSENTVLGVLKSENSQTPTGTIKQGDKVLALRVSGDFKNLNDIKRLPILTPKNSVVYMEDIADISEQFIENKNFSYVNGIPSITLTIQKQSTANTVEVSSGVLKEVAKIQKEIPGIKFEVLDDPAVYINRSISNVTSSALLGGILAILILYVFLRNVRSTLVVAIAIPVSIIATFILMYYSNLTINLMSLGGLTLGVGMLVDNSIVVLESIYRKIEEGEDRIKAAIEGAREVAMSVVASTLTTVAVFLPITFSGGFTATLFNNLALTIAFSLLSSLFISLTFVPMVCSIILKPSIITGETEKPNIFNKFLGMIKNTLDALDIAYRKILAKALKRRNITLLIVTIFVIGTFLTLPLIGMDLMPATDESKIAINISMPKGTLVTETQKVTDKVLEIATKEPEVISYSVIVGGEATSLNSLGGSSEDVANIALSVVPKTQRTESSAQIAERLGKKLENIAGAKITSKATSGALGSFSSGAGFQVEIKGEDLDKLIRTSKDVLKILESIDGTNNVESSVSETSPQATIKVNRDKASSYGISASSIASVIKTAIQGNVPTTLKVSGDEIDIRVSQDMKNINYISDLQNILIPSQSGINVPLYEIAEIKVENLPTSISRINQQKTVTISAVISKDSATITNAFKAKMSNYVMDDGYEWALAGNQEQMNETFASLGLALIMAILLVYMIMAAQFENFVYPLIVMFSIPIALTGGIFGLFVMNQPLTMNGFVGLIMLAGIVINNAIVLVDYTNLLRRERGYTALDALLKAGPVRLRPILMTTLTTVLALLPMMFSGAEGAELMRGLAVVVAFGLTLSTAVTLLLIPTVYLSYSLKFDKKEKELLNKGNN